MHKISTQLEQYIWNRAIRLTVLINYIHYEMLDGITYPFPNFNGAIAEVWE